MGQKQFRSGAKSSTILFSPVEIEKTTFLQKISWKNVKFQNLGGGLSPLPTPMLLKLFMTKRLRKITKIDSYTNK